MYFFVQDNLVKQVYMYYVVDEDIGVKGSVMIYLGYLMM